MTDNGIPSIPLPPAAGGVPPVEPAPAVPPVEPSPATPPAPPAAPAPPAPPAVPAAPEPLPPVASAARPDPYAAPGATPSPYVQPGYPAPPAGYPGQPQYAYAPVAAGPAQGLSIGSMITGIGAILLSFVGFGFLPAVAAVILGHIAQRRQPYARPFWITGLITGYIAIGFSLIGLLILVVSVVSGVLGGSYY